MFKSLETWEKEILKFFAVDKNKKLLLILNFTKSIHNNA